MFDCKIENIEYFEYSMADERVREGSEGGEGRMREWEEFGIKIF